MIIVLGYEEGGFCVLLKEWFRRGPFNRVLRLPLSRVVQGTLFPQELPETRC